jgi:hypothetical protein
MSYLLVIIADFYIKYKDYEPNHPLLLLQQTLQ